MALEKHEPSFASEHGAHRLKLVFFYSRWYWTLGHEILQISSLWEGSFVFLDSSSAAVTRLLRLAVFEDQMLRLPRANRFLRKGGFQCLDGRILNSLLTCNTLNSHGMPWWSSLRRERPAQCHSAHRGSTSADSQLQMKRATNTTEPRKQLTQKRRNHPKQLSERLSGEENPMPSHCVHLFFEKTSLKNGNACIHLHDL